ncbi:MAG: lipopolysaccharide heptosyltransferase I [Planctomycetota bacterium]|nr:lipopolysaccharide heptosyltransferase I [Planctomycetota bacterium]
MADRIPLHRILIVRPSALGDVCRSVPVLASLHRAHPQAAIDWVVRDSFRPAIAAHPALHEAIAFPRSRFARWWRSPAALSEMLRWGGDLRRRRYDLVIDCQGLGRSGLITSLTAAPRRVGWRDARELAWLGYNVRHRTPSDRHTVDRMLALLEAEGIEPVRDMRLYVAEDDRRWWADRHGEPDLGGAPYAVLAPTARWPSKRWPLDRWGELVKPLLKRGMKRLVVIGAPDERPQTDRLFGAGGGADAALVDLVGRLTIGQLMAVIAQANLVVAHDSAPLHLAVGFDRPCVGLFGPTDPGQVGPYRRPEAVVCRHRPGPGEKTVNYRATRLGDELMRLITVEDVLERIDAVLETASRVPAAARETVR